MKEPLIVLGALALLALVATGCGASDGFKAGYNDARHDTADCPSMTLCRSDYGKRWPLTVDEVLVSCDKDGDAVRVFASSGATKYAVNGAARTARPDLPTIDDVWADNPDHPGLKINIDPIIEAGLKLCTKD